MVPPPSRASCSRKLSALRLGSANRSTRLTIPRKCRATLAAVTSFSSSGYNSGSSAIKPTLALLPLSPERAWASQRSWRRTGGPARRRPVSTRPPLLLLISPSHFPPPSRGQNFDPHVRLDLPAIDQCGPVGDDLFHGRPAPGEPGDAGGTGEHQRGDLP